MKQYFMYGIIISYQIYLDMETTNTIEDVLKSDNGIQGIFTGRNGEFIIVGTILETVKDNNEPHVVPVLSDINMKILRNRILEKYGLKGEFNYYFIKD
jgi:hypothetical protein